MAVVKEQPDVAPFDIISPTRKTALETVLSRYSKALGPAEYGKLRLEIGHALLDAFQAGAAKVRVLERERCADAVFPLAGGDKAAAKILRMRDPGRRRADKADMPKGAKP